VERGEGNRILLINPQLLMKGYWCWWCKGPLPGLLCEGSNVS